MTREQLGQVATVEDLLQMKLSIIEEFDHFKNMVRSLRSDLERAGTVNPEKLHYSIKEFAAKLGVGSRAVHNWIHEGIVSASQPNGFGSTWIIPVSELERMTDEGYAGRKRRPIQ